MSQPGQSQRLDSIDLLRGLVILIMALDHTRDFFGSLAVDPMDYHKTWPALYLTRWISHFCAPTFVFLAGVSAWLQAQRKSPQELTHFLVTRGLWLVVLELTYVRCFGWFFNFHYRFSVGQVIWAIGWSMVSLGIAIRLRITPRIAAVTGLAIIFCHNLTDPIKAEQFGPLWWLWRILHDRKNMELWPGHVFFPQYPLLPWMGILFAGYGFGQLYALAPELRRRWTLRIGLAATALFVVIRAINIYGDPRLWQPAGGLYSFLNCTKYPPSLLYALMTLGPALMLLSRLPDTASGRLQSLVVLFGRVPMFFYLLHVPLLHGAAYLYAETVFGVSGWLTDGPGWSGVAPPAGFAFDLPGVYLIWLAALGISYPLCAWFAGYKRRNTAVWLSYF